MESDEPRLRTEDEEVAWQAARQVVLERDERRCVACGEPASQTAPLHVHHLIPRSGGGADHPSNLITLCPTCHAARHTNMLVSLARFALERWAVKLALFFDRSLPRNIEQIHAALRLLGAERLRDGQLDIILAALAGRSVLAVLPTGYGKSLCFQVPALLAERHTLVVSPLKALMSDQVRTLFERRIPALFINGDLSPAERSLRYGLLQKDALRLLYVAPERFNPNMLSDPSETRRLLDSRPSFLVVDEAHCIDRWGDDFRPDYGRLGEVRRELGGVPVLAFTATAGIDMQDRIMNSLGVPEADRFIRDVDRPNISYARSSIEDASARGELVAELHAKVGGRALVFVPTLAKGREAVAGLASAGIDAPFYHGRLPANERELILARLQGRNDPPLSLVVCTNAFGMGIDLPDVRLVVHWAFPASIEDYVQESGRAGRDGKASLALLFHSHRDRGLQEYMARQAGHRTDSDDAEERLALSNKLDGIARMEGLAEGQRCVRQRIADHFGEGTTPRRSLSARFLAWLVSRKRHQESATWCCDYCTPDWLQRV